MTHRSMRSWIAVVVAALFVACGTAPKKSHSTERKGLIITLTDSVFTAAGSDTVRFGRLHSGEIAVLRVCLANDAQRPVLVTGYDRSCGCTALEYRAEPIPPGGAQQMELRFDSRGEYGWQLKTLDLHLAGAQHPLRIFVEADVE